MSVRTLLFTGQALDAVSFALVVTLAPLLFVGEINPLIGALYSVGGVFAVMIAKIGATSAFCWWATSHPVRRRVRVVMVFAATMGFVGAAANLFTLGSLLALGMG